MAIVAEFGCGSGQQAAVPDHTMNTGCIHIGIHIAATVATVFIA
jgi:hypothetical protein